MRPDKKKEKDKATVQHSGTGEQHSGKFPCTLLVPCALLGFCDGMVGSHARDK